MTLTLRHSEGLGDWYVIERNGRDITDANVEGTLEEMRGIAQAIRVGTNYYAKRCAVSIREGKAFFWSPRNSVTKGEATLGEAVSLATQIEALGEPSKLEALLTELQDELSFEASTDFRDGVQHVIDRVRALLEEEKENS